MKRLICFSLLAILFTFPVEAANTNPSGTFGQMFWNNGLGQFAPVTIGQGLCLSTTPTGCVAPIPPTPPSGALLTDNNGNLLTDDSGNQLTAN